MFWPQFRMLVFCRQTNWLSDLFLCFIDQTFRTNESLSVGRLVDFTIEVNNNPTGGNAADICAQEDIPYNSSETRVYPCPLNLVGRYVKIFFNPSRADHLQLCEVQVQGSKLMQKRRQLLPIEFKLSSSFIFSKTLLCKANSYKHAVSKPQISFVLFCFAGLSPNIALNGIADQSTDHHHTYLFSDPDSAQYAIDGDFNSDMYMQSGRCAQTEATAGAWWRLDLLTEYHVSAVAITTRKNHGN